MPFYPREEGERDIPYTLKTRVEKLVMDYCHLNIAQVQELPIDTYLFLMRVTGMSLFPIDVALSPTRSKACPTLSSVTLLSFAWLSRFFKESSVAHLFVFNAGSHDL